MIAEQQAFERLRLAYHEVVLKAYKEAQDSQVAFIQYWDRMEALEDAVDNSASAVKISQVAFAEGATEFNRVYLLQSELVRLQDAVRMRRIKERSLRVWSICMCRLVADGKRLESATYPLHHVDGDGKPKYTASGPGGSTGSGRALGSTTPRRRRWTARRSNQTGRVWTATSSCRDKRDRGTQLATSSHRLSFAVAITLNGQKSRCAYTQCHPLSKP